MKLNLPNKLTVLRLCLVPVVMVFILYPALSGYNSVIQSIVCTLLFILTAVTDFIDGKIARKYNLITDFGKFLDPLADKMLTTAAFLAFIKLGIGYGITWITFIILIREFLITSLRLISACKGKVVAANMWGKLKTVAQMASIVFILASQYFMTLFNVPVANQIINIITNIVLWASAVLTVISGLTYVADNKQFIDPRK